MKLYRKGYPTEEWKTLRKNSIYGNQNIFFAKDEKKLRDIIVPKMAASGYNMSDRVYYCVDVPDNLCTYNLGAYGTSDEGSDDFIDEFICPWWVAEEYGYTILPN